MAQNKEAGERVKVYLPGGGIATCSPEQVKKCGYRVRSDEDEASEDGPTSAELRAWAQENDVPCPAKGKVPASVVEAYEAAN